MNGHRNDVKNGYCLLHRHFRLEDHSVEDMKVQILENVSHHSKSPGMQKWHRECREDFWIRELGTAAPYGCNNKIKGVGILTSPSCQKTNVLSLFNQKQRRKRSHGRRHYNKPTQQDSHQLFNDLKARLKDSVFQPQGPHKIKTELFALSLAKLCSLQKVALETHNFDCESAEYRTISMICDIAQYRLFRPVRNNLSVESSRYFLKLKFLNKGIDAINLASVFRDKSATDQVPEYFKGQDPPMITYEYTNTIAGKILNFSSALSNLDIRDFLENPPDCNCKSSAYCYPTHGHVITGDLTIIDNHKLKDLILKGPKYREPTKVNWVKNKSMIFDAIDLYAKKWAKREKEDLSLLSLWKEKVKSIIETRISKLERNFKQPNHKVLENHSVKECLKQLHEKFVFVPADKAGNNVIIVCKRYYIETLVKELGMDKPTSNNPTYQPCDIPVDTIINTHQLFVSSVGLKVSEEDKKLPYLYWTPKLHKDPIGHRFIAGSGKCSTKDLSSLLTKILTVIKNGLKRYCDVKTSHNSVNNMWILKNSKELLSSLEHQRVHKAKSIQTFDFSTLYTSIPHDLLKSRITSLVHNSFKQKDGKIRYSFIKAGKYGNCYFSRKVEEGEGQYSEGSICKMIEFLIDNIYVTFGGLHFRQVIGIPMGTNCAPLLADLFLYSYESEFLDKLIRANEILHVNLI